MRKSVCSLVYSSVLIHCSPMTSKSPCTPAVRINHPDCTAGKVGYSWRPVHYLCRILESLCTLINTTHMKWTQIQTDRSINPSSVTNIIIISQLREDQPSELTLQSGCFRCPFVCLSVCLSRCQWMHCLHLSYLKAGDHSDILLHMYLFIYPQRGESSSAEWWVTTWGRCRPCRGWTGAGGAVTPVHVQIPLCPTSLIRNGEQWKLCTVSLGANPQIMIQISIIC